MIITCPHCSARYKVKDDLITEKGKKVKCKKCTAIFVAYPNSESKLVTAPPLDTVPADTGQTSPAEGSPSPPTPGPAPQATVKVDRTQLEDFLKRTGAGPTPDQSTVKIDSGQVEQFLRNQVPPGSKEPISAQATVQVDRSEINHFLKQTAATQDPPPQAPVEFPAAMAPAPEPQQAAISQPELPPEPDFSAFDFPAPPDETNAAEPSPGQASMFDGEHDFDFPPPSEPPPWQDEAPQDAPVSEDLTTQLITPQPATPQPATPQPAAPQPAAPLPEEPQFPEPQQQEPQSTEPQFSEPQMAEPTPPEPQLPAPASNLYQASVDGNIYGDLGLPVLERWIEEGRLLEKDKIAPSGTESYRDAKDYPEIKAYFDKYFGVTAVETTPPQKKGFFARLFSKK